LFFHFTRPLAAPRPPRFLEVAHEAKSSRLVFKLSGRFRHSVPSIMISARIADDMGSTPCDLSETAELQLGLWKGALLPFPAPGLT
jgi:hypothetical protein